MRTSPPATAERRLWPRRPKRIAVFITDPDDALGERLKGVVVDRSRNGLCLAVASTDIDEGSVLTIRPVNAKAGTPWVAIQVKNRRVVDETHVELGCEFQPAQPVNTILMLG